MPTPWTTASGDAASRAAVVTPVASMRTRVAILATGVILVAAIAVFLGLARSDGVDRRPVVSPYAQRTVQAGAVTVTVKPVRIDPSVAVLRLTLDTHAGPLDVDLVESARFDVAGTRWATASWSGDGAGGRHREGDLRFVSPGTETRGAPGARARLTLRGLPHEVSMSWELLAR